jgi:hypothetical protein
MIIIMMTSISRFGNVRPLVFPPRLLVVAVVVEGISIVTTIPTVVVTSVVVIIIVIRELLVGSIPDRHSGRPVAALFVVWLPVILRGCQMKRWMTA